MGWFVLSAGLGALLCWGWRLRVPDTERIQFLVAGSAFAALLVGLVLWAIFVEGNYSTTRVLRAIDHGHVARFLLGLLLGFVIAYARPWGLITNRDFLWLAVVVVILASVAPNLDNWMSRLSSLKSAGFEIQLAGTTTLNHKVAVAHKIDTYASGTAFIWLSGYSGSIKREIDYLENVEGKASPNDKQIISTSTKNQIRIFDEVISPIAACFRTMLQNGLSLERLREIMRPRAHMLQQIVFNLDDPTLSNPDKHAEFWSSLLTAADDLQKWRMKNGDKCLDITKRFKAVHQDIYDIDAYPIISKSQKQPHLYVAAALFMLAVDEGDAALRLLEEAETRVQPDYFYLLLLGTLRNLQGQPAVRAIQPWRAILKRSQERQRMLKWHCRQIKCEAAYDDMKAREISYEIIAMNEIAFTVAQDIARGIPSAKEFEATAEAYALKLYDAVKSNKNDDIEPDTLLDTYAYTLMVVETQKSRPNVDTFKTLARIFQNIVDGQSAELKRILDGGTPLTKTDLFNLSVTRTHLQSARELAGE